MSKSATMSLRLTHELKEKLGQLARETDRTPSAIAQQGLSEYVDQRLWMLSEIDKSIEDFKEGRTVPHTEAVARIHATIARYEKVDP
ncbi:CopG family ribbon-helix-helix protein [uncultured Brevundimonas sp.]|uniref:CopG family ribbon-helix-helix protein n=1 Tax=uncultured Brevundimonas sp. TaxID=213418 RepID=UPI002617EC30|nr:CopG family ribbon-helix-helix protein [uncultured Brevundimonas sp.]